MAVAKMSPGYQIEGRVSIAFDALSDEQRSAVAGVIADREHFIAGLANRRKVRRLSKRDPFYALSVPHGLRIVFSKVGDEIVVMDLMRKETLELLGQPDPRKAASQHKGTKLKPVPNASRAKKAK